MGTIEDYNRRLFSETEMALDLDRAEMDARDREYHAKASMYMDEVEEANREVAKRLAAKRATNNQAHIENILKEIKADQEDNETLFLGLEESEIRDIITKKIEEAGTPLTKDDLLKRIKRDTFDANRRSIRNILTMDYELSIHELDRMATIVERDLAYKCLYGHLSAYKPLTIDTTKSLVASAMANYKRPTPSRSSESSTDTDYVSIQSAKFAEARKKAAEEKERREAEEQKIKAEEQRRRDAGIDIETNSVTTEDELYRLAISLDELFGKDAFVPKKLYESIRFTSVKLHKNTKQDWHGDKHFRVLIGYQLNRSNEFSVRANSSDTRDGAQYLKHELSNGYLKRFIEYNDMSIDEVTDMPTDKPILPNWKAEPKEKRESYGIEELMFNHFKLIVEDSTSTIIINCALGKDFYVDRATQWIMMGNYTNYTPAKNHKFDKNDMKQWTEDSIHNLKYATQYVRIAGKSLFFKETHPVRKTQENGDIITEKKTITWRVNLDNYKFSIVDETYNVDEKAPYVDIYAETSEPEEESEELDTFDNKLGDKLESILGKTKAILMSGRITKV